THYYNAIFCQALGQSKYYFRLGFVRARKPNFLAQSRPLAPYSGRIVSRTSDAAEAIARFGNSDVFPDSRSRCWQSFFHVHSERGRSAHAATAFAIFRIEGNGADNRRAFPRLNLETDLFQIFGLFLWPIRLHGDIECSSALQTRSSNGQIHRGLPKQILRE